MVERWDVGRSMCVWSVCRSDREEDRDVCVFRCSFAVARRERDFRWDGVVLRAVCVGVIDVVGVRERCSQRPSRVQLTIITCLF